MGEQGISSEIQEKTAAGQCLFIILCNKTVNKEGSHGAASVSIEQRESTSLSC